LAGPGVFLQDPNSYFANKRNICLKYDILGISPFDSELNADIKEPIVLAEHISSNNEKIMHNCDIIIADLTPWHGPSADVGTAFELGFMRALNKPLYAYSNDPDSFYDRVLKMIGPVNGTDMLGRELVNGFAIENFGMNDNLMLHGALHHSGSRYFCGKVDQSEKYTSLVHFERAVKYASSK
jgi:nucleoside 2-deoxyribosyltransferase